MSLYTEWLNKIKSQSDSSWLTDSQKKAFNDLTNRWQGHQFINFCGPQGSGKSFVARLLNKEREYFYTHRLEDAPENLINVIVDDATYGRYLRDLAFEKKIQRVILITDTPIKEAMPICKLSLEEKDVIQFVKTLADNCQIFFKKTEPEGLDLDRILIKEIQTRGEQTYEH